MKNKLPESVKLFGQTISIIYSEKIPAGERVSGGDYDDELFGKTFPLDGTIYINNSTSEVVQRSTLLHELMHCISDALYLNLSEKQVCGLEAGLYSIIKEVQYND
jgi:hypothetical protein